MHPGNTVEEVIKRIVHDRDHKKDFIIPTKALTMMGDGSLSFWLGEEERSVKPTPLCLSQIAERAGIPKGYADKMLKAAPALLAKNVNHWFDAEPDNRMLRTLQNGTAIGRAFLSSSFRPLDNADIASHVLPRLQEAGCDIKSAAVTDTKLYIQAVSSKVVGEVKKVGDVVHAGVVISNSEVGCGSLRVEHLIYTLRCTNGMIAGNVVKKAHVGRRKHDGIEEASEFFSEETQRADDTALWLKVRDIVAKTLSQEAFDEVLAKLNKTAAVEVKSPMKVVEVLAERFAWQKAEQSAIFDEFLRGGMPTQYGLMNAVTRAAQDVTSYDRAVELERQGGEIIELPASDFANN